MRVVLGPYAADSKNYGSVPQDEQCVHALDLNAGRVGGTGWVRGHLLNDNFGGRGDSENLIPLTMQANSEHSGRVEGPIKKFLEISRQFYQYERHPIIVGVDYTVNIQQNFTKGQSYLNVGDDEKEKIEASLLMETPTGIRCVAIPIIYRIEGSHKIPFNPAENQGVTTAVRGHFGGPIREFRLPQDRIQSGALIPFSIDRTVLNLNGPPPPVRR